MNQAVMIKSSKNGINLLLNSELDFQTLLDEILKKFQESEKFFSDAEFAISFEGKELTDEEKYQIVDAIMTNTDIKIRCIVDYDEIKDAVIQKKMKDMAEKEAKQKQATGTFYYGSLKPGERLEVDAAIVILGNVPKDACVISKSSIVVLGTLLGEAYAGMDGDKQSFIAALRFMPETYNISGLYGSKPQAERGFSFSKRNKIPEAKIALISEGLMTVHPFLEEGLDNYI